jgi:pimeloyl-ACP methyl ester carboxylesterase
VSTSIEQNAVLERIATEAVTPNRREPRASNVTWESRDTAGPVAYWSSGTGPGVLLVHGWEGSHADLDAFVAPLLARGMRVVALDLPAHGESSGRTASPLECGQAILTIAARIGPLAGAIGHSAGAPSIAFALQRGLHVESVALVATPDRYERYIRWFADENGVDAGALIALMKARGIDVPALVISENAARFDVPALIVHSIDDRTCDVRGARRIAAAWRDSELLEVDGLGHNRILRDPGVIERVTNFMKRTLAAAICISIMGACLAACSGNAADPPASWPASSQRAPAPVLNVRGQLRYPSQVAELIAKQTGYTGAFTFTSSNRCVVEVLSAPPPSLASFPHSTCGAQHLRSPSGIAWAYAAGAGQASISARGSGEGTASRKFTIETPGNVVIEPSRLRFTRLGEHLQVEVSQDKFVGAFIESDDCSGAATIAPRSGRTGDYTVTSHAVGSCTAWFTGASRLSGSLPISVRTPAASAPARS